MGPKRTVPSIPKQTKHSDRAVGPWSYSPNHELLRHKNSSNVRMSQPSPAKPLGAISLNQDY